MGKDRCRLPTVSNYLKTLFIISFLLFVVSIPVLPNGFWEGGRTFKLEGNWLLETMGPLYYWYNDSLWHTLNLLLTDHLTYTWSLDISGIPLWYETWRDLTLGSLNDLSTMFSTTEDSRISIIRWNRRITPCIVEGGLDLTIRSDGVPTVVFSQ